MFLRQSTAQTFRFGPFLDITDGVTEETGLTITPALRRLSKDGAAFATASGAVNATHDSDGWYSASLTTTDTNTVGELVLNVQIPATALPVWMRFYVVEESVYDNMFASAAVGPLTAAQVNTEADTALTDYDGPTDAEMIARTLLAASYFDPAADAVANVTLVATTTTNTDMVAAAPTAAAIADAVWDELLAGHVIADSSGLLLNDWQDGGRLDLLLDAIPTTAMRGTDSAALASVCTETRLAELDAANLPTDVGAIPTTAMRGTDSAALASVATEARLAELDATNLPATTDATLVDTGTTIPAQITALNNLSAAEILTTQLTEAYAADGVAPTLTQALFLVQQMLGDFGIAGTTLTVRQIDGATTAATFTLDDGTNPTDITRAT